MELPIWGDMNPPLYDSVEESSRVIPTYEIFMPEKPNGKAMIIFPGGGYHELVDPERKPFVDIFCELGYVSVLCLYRVAPYRHPCALIDAQRVIRTVRYRSEELGINEIYTIGFSAGGHVAMHSALRYDYGKNDGDAIDRISCRPDKAVLSYPVTTFMRPFCHEGSVIQHLGPNPSEEARRELSGEFMVKEDAPPIFIWGCTTDETVPIQNSYMLADALTRKGIMNELHVFPEGVHGPRGYYDHPVLKELIVNFLNK